jgi:LCP family protein required for cell wall assembly
MTARLGRVVLVPIAAGIALALVITSAWIAIGRPTPARGATWFTVTKVGEANWTGQSDQPFYALVLGNDGRDAYDQQRGDAIHVIGVNPAQGKATILDIPRDTAADIPGYGHEKINAAHSYGGLPLMVQTVENLVGIDISYAITTNFPDFIAMVDAMGGVDVNVPTEMSDSNSGTNFQPGPNHFDGNASLAFNRDRHSFPAGDLKRSENQGLYLISALATLRAQNPGAAGTMRLMTILAQHTRSDGMDLGEEFRLAMLGLALDPANVRNVVLPVGSGSGTNLAVQSEAESLFADIRDDAVLQTH